MKMEALETLVKETQTIINSGEINQYIDSYSQLDCSVCSCWEKKRQDDLSFLNRFDEQSTRRQVDTDFFPTTTGFGISYKEMLPKPYDFHDTFKEDRYGNVYEGHSTLAMKNKKRRFDWWE